MRRRYCLLGLSMALIFLIGCDVFTSVQGIVSGPDGRPVVAATVRLVAIKSGKTKEVKTAEDGSFSLAVAHGAFAGRFQLSISKQGYSTFRQDVAPKSISRIAVVLNRQAVGSGITE